MTNANAPSDNETEREIDSGTRCPSCRAYWSWCCCTHDAITAAREARRA